MRKSDYSTDMHNKYVIVDDEAILTGSMNWNIVVSQLFNNILCVTFSSSNIIE
jgi:hypothetical protein